MKNLIILLFAFVTVFIYSCQKEETESVQMNGTTISHEAGSTTVDPKGNPLPHVLWPKIVVSKGTYSGSTCGLSLPCGPCSGICVKIHWKITEGNPGSGEIEVGASLTNDTTMHVVFRGGQIDDGHGNSIIENSFNIGPDASDFIAGRDSIIIRQGTYPINYSNYTYGETDYRVTVY